MVTDPIADMLTQLKNAARVGKASVTVPLSNVKAEIAGVLLKHGYLANVTKQGRKNYKYLTCELAFHAGQPKITEVKRLSKPSRRLYQKAAELRPIRQGKGMAVLSTPKGILSDREAKTENVGGELLFTIW